MVRISGLATRTSMSCTRTRERHWRSVPVPSRVLGARPLLSLLRILSENSQGTSTKVWTCLQLHTSSFCLIASRLTFINLSRKFSPVWIGSNSLLMRIYSQLWWQSIPCLPQGSGRFTRLRIPLVLINNVVTCPLLLCSCLSKSPRPGN